MKKQQKSTDEFLEQLEKDMLAGKTFPTPEQQAELEKNYLAGRRILAENAVGPGVLPTDNGLEKKRFT